MEYAYADLSEQISAIRIKELAAVRRNILVTCPICLLNLSKYETACGVKVWDMGELLHLAGSVRRNTTMNAHSNRCRPVGVGKRTTA